ncbi:alpha/beta fold hydrolase [Nonomuraea thailandensis]
MPGRPARRPRTPARPRVGLLGPLLGSDGPAADRIPSRPPDRPARSRPVGQTGRPELRHPDQARRAGEALDRLGVRQAVVAGHSSGGVVATALAELRPGLVTALALVNTGPSLDA